MAATLKSKSTGKKAPAKKLTYTEQIDEILDARHKSSGLPSDRHPGRSWISENDGNHDDETQYEIYTEDNTEASFSIEQLPGCCGVAVGHSFQIPDDLWPVVNKLMQQLAYDRKYTLLVCTQLTSCKAYVKAMGNCDWDRREFKSRGTGNRVSFDVIQLKDTGTKIGLDCDPNEASDYTPF